MAAADIEVATVTVDHAPKPAADTSAAAAVEREWSPLCSPTSTVEERNLYLRTIGTDRMKEVNDEGKFSHTFDLRLADMYLGSVASRVDMEYRARQSCLTGKEVRTGQHFQRR